MYVDHSMFNVRLFKSKKCSYSSTSFIIELNKTRCIFLITWVHEIDKTSFLLTMSKKVLHWWTSCSVCNKFFIGKMVDSCMNIGLPYLTNNNLFWEGSWIFISFRDLQTFLQNVILRVTDIGSFLCLTLNLLSLPLFHFLRCLRLKML